jgi:hypothetical protein
MDFIEKLKALIEKLKAIGDAIRDRTGTTDEMTLDEMAEAIKSMEVADDDTNTYILVDENGNEIPAVLVDEPVMLTANPRTDIRKGMTAVTDEGVVTGEKEIPAYHTSEGYKLIPSGSKFTLPIMYYDFTRLQAILCPFNTSLTNSVAADKVVIERKVYPAQSTVSESDVVVNESGKYIDLGLSNTSGKPYLIRYFTYKEIF